MRRWHLWTRQPLHLALLLLLCGLLRLAGLLPGFRVSQSWNVTVATVAVVSVAAGILHQLWILLFWRLELGSSAVSRTLGRAGFGIYAAGFVLLLSARFGSILYLAPLNGGTLAVAVWLRLTAIAVFALIGGWGVFSVLRYFGLRRAFGLDHFDPSVRDAGLVRRGAYRYTPNVMYLFVLPVFLVPGLLWGSVASLFVGLFHYAGVWVHYYCTELPDMEVIYGPSDQAGPPG